MAWQDDAVAAECKRANQGLRSLGKEGEVVLVTGDGGGVVEQPLCSATLAHFKNALGNPGTTGGGKVTASGSETMLIPQQQLVQSILQRMCRQVRTLDRCIAAAVAQGEQHRNATTWVPLAQQLNRADSATEEAASVAAPLVQANRCDEALHLTTDAI